MEIDTSEAALDLIRSRGGRLYVWVARGRCCGASNLTLATSTAAPPHTDFAPVDGADGFELYLPRAIGRHPARLEIARRRFPDRLEAYWDGCAWVV